MPTYTEVNRIGDVLKREFDVLFNRETGVLLSGQNLACGRVLGRITVGAAAAAAKSGGNTGNGTLTMDATTPVLANAKVGVYVVRLVATATNGGTFRVEDPDGIVLGDVAVGGTFSDGIKFATADGATDFALGDGFDITVAAGSGKWAAHLSTATDGRQRAAGILLFDTDASAADKPCVVLARGPAVVADGALAWEASVSAGTRAAGLAALNALGIVARRTV